MTSATRATQKARARRAAQKARSARTKGGQWSADEAAGTGQLPIDDSLDGACQNVLLLHDLEPDPPVWDNPPPFRPSDTAIGYRGAVRITLTDPETGASAETWLTADPDDIRMHLHFCYARFGWSAVAQTHEQLHAANVHELRRQHAIEEALERGAAGPPGLFYWEGPVESTVILANWYAATRAFTGEIYDHLLAVEARARAIAHQSLDRSERTLSRAVDDYFTRDKPTEAPPNANALTTIYDYFADPGLGALFKTPENELEVRQDSPAVRDLRQLLADLIHLNAEIREFERRRDRLPIGTRHLPVYRTATQNLLAAKGRRAQRIQQSASRFPMTFRLLEAPYQYGDANQPVVPVLESVGTPLTNIEVQRAVSAAFARTATAIEVQRAAAGPLEQAPPNRSLDTMPHPQEPRLQSPRAPGESRLRNPGTRIFGTALPAKGRRGAWDYPNAIARALDDLGHGPGSAVRAAAQEALEGFPIPWDLQLFFDTAKVVIGVGIGAVLVEAWDIKTMVVDEANQVDAEEAIHRAVLDPNDALAERPDRQQRVREALLGYIIENHVVSIPASKLPKLSSLPTIVDNGESLVLLVDYAQDIATNQAASKAANAVTRTFSDTGDVPLVPTPLFATAVASIAVGEMPGRVTLGTSLLPRALAAEHADVATAWVRWGRSWFACERAWRNQAALAFARRHLDDLVAELQKVRGRYAENVRKRLDIDLAILRDRSQALAHGVDQLRPTENVRPEIPARQIQHPASAGVEGVRPKLRDLARIEHGIADITGPGQSAEERATILRTFGQWREATTSPDLAATFNDGKRRALAAIADPLQNALDRAMSGERRTPRPRASGKKPPAAYRREDIDPTVRALGRRGRQPPLDPWEFLGAIGADMMARPFAPEARYFHEWVAPAAVRAPEAWGRLCDGLSGLPAVKQPPEISAVCDRAEGLVSELVAVGSVAYQYTWRRALVTASDLAAHLNAQASSQSKEAGARGGSWRVVEQSGALSGTEGTFPGGIIAVFDRASTNGTVLLVLSAQRIGGLATPRSLRDAMNAQQRLFARPLFLGGRKVTVDDGADTREVTRIFTGQWTDGFDQEWPSRVTISRTGDPAATAPLTRASGDAIFRCAFTRRLLSAAGKIP